MSFKETLSAPGIMPVFFTLFMVSFGFGVILPILPFYVISLGAEPFQLGMLTATFAFMSLVFSPLMGRLGDSIGRKKILLLGTVGFFISYAIFAITDSLEMAFLARAIEGIAAAAIFPSCISLISDLTSERERGPAMGMVGMAFSLGFIAGPAIGGIASSFAVKDVFILSAFLSLLNFASIYFQVKEPKEKEESRDIIQKEATLFSHLASPLLFLFLSAMMITFMIGGLDATLALYTGEKLGFSSPQIGIVFTYLGALIMIMQAVSGSLINRFGELAMIRTGLFISGAGFFLLAFSSDWVSLLAPLAIFVCGNAMVFPSVTSLITKKVQGKRGAVLGLVSSFQSTGQFLGPLFGGFLYGVNHTSAFMGFAILIWAYFLVFFLFGTKRLN